jgi:pimeloyl-ACP methyl ester carboxylesterase
MRVLYLHGFASSPGSRKARLFIEKLAAHNATVEALQLAPDFPNLTISSQLQVVEKIGARQPVFLIGSSLGGYLSALYAANHREVSRLILLAPAFDFYRLWQESLGPQKLEFWRENGSVNVFHYGEGKELPLNYRFMEDAAAYPPFPAFRQPCLILHGDRDTVVPIAKSVEFVAQNPNARLVPLPSGHEMTDVLDEIWKYSSTFLLEGGSEFA